MALIKCPECGKQVSDKATACPSCGYPINNGESIIQEIELSSDVCPICKSINKHINVSGNDTCEECGYIFKRSKTNQEIHSQKIQKTHCPFCNSTNVNKISTAKKATSIIGLGILSNKIGKQWHCNNCKSDF